MRELDLAVGCGPPMRNNEPQRTGTRNKAYPSVVVTLADMQQPAVNYIIALYHNSMCMADRDKFIEDTERNIDQWVGTSCNTELAKKQIQEMPEFYMVGVAVGTAYAHPNTGDTVATVMIGGLKTVLNGAFPVQCNDEIMWYWEEERPCFKADGKRQNKKVEGRNGAMTSEDVTRFINGLLEIDADDERRRKFFDRGNGNFAAPSRDGNIKGKQRIAYPKPFRYEDDNERIYDRRRVFAKALCSARPFEPLDIMVCRQSL